jgi:hypothetical protein
MPLVTTVSSSKRWRSESSRMTEMAMLAVRSLGLSRDATRPRNPQGENSWTHLFVLSRFPSNVSHVIGRGIFKEEGFLCCC